MPRVLLVDDDVDALALRRRIFQRNGSIVEAVSCAARAREEFRAARPDVVVLDLRLPELADGLALIREFRGAGNGVRIVVLAGWCGDIEGRPESALVDMILSKPIRSDVLVRAVLGSGTTAG
jgi:DNA-binding response OmpR family regulator